MYITCGHCRLQEIGNGFTCSVIRRYLGTSAYFWWISGGTTNYPAGNGNTITFKKDKHYTRVRVSAGVITTENGTFWLSTTTYSRGEKIININFKSSNATQNIRNVSIINNLLYLSDGYADGFTSAYIKQ